MHVAAADGVREPAQHRYLGQPDRLTLEQAELFEDLRHDRLGERLQARVETSLEQISGVVLLGPRQVGKTTLVLQIASTRGERARSSRHHGDTFEQDVPSQSDSDITAARVSGRRLST